MWTLLQREIDGHGHHHRHCLAVEQCRCELPLAHGVDGGSVEHRNGAQDPDVTDGAVGLDATLEDDDTLNACGARLGRVLRVDVLCLDRDLDAAADPYRSVADVS